MPFVHKVLEKVVAKQLDAHFENNEFLDVYQSTYRKFHSTETTLTKVQSDIIGVLDSGGFVVMILLDLSAAFDTVDHSILLNRLQMDFHIGG